MPIAFIPLSAINTGATASGKVWVQGLALATGPMALASGTVPISGQAFAKPPLPPLLGSTIDAQADGAITPGGHALAQALLPAMAVAWGQVAMKGQAEGEVAMATIPPTPPIFVTTNGWVSVQGDAYGAVNIPAYVDRHAGLSGRASSGALAQGSVSIIGHAGQAFAGGQASFFLIEMPGVIQSYAGISFERMNEVLALGSTPDALYSAVTDEPFYLGSHAGSRYRGRLAMAERLALVSRLVWLIHEILHSGLALNSPVKADYTAIAKLINRLLLTGEATGYAAAQQKLLDAWVWASLSHALPKADNVETLAFSGQLDRLYTAYGALLEQMALRAPLSGRYTLTVLLDERFVLKSEADFYAQCLAQLRDCIGFALHLELDDGQYVAWVMNTQSRAVHRYVNYPFNSFATLGQQDYGLHSGGLMRLHSGADDNGQPIEARVRLGLFDWGSRQVKGLPECFFGLSTDGNMLLKAIFVDAVSGEKQAAIYQLEPRPAHAARETRVRLGRGMQAVDWDFELTNVNGADFDWHHVEFHPTHLSRRVRS